MASPVAQVLTYRLTPTTRLILQRGDLTKFTGGAIVNAANERCLGGGGVDGAIHRAAGPELRTECEKLEQVRPGVRCPTGEARITLGNFGSLNVQYVIHTVGPVYDSDSASAPLLGAAYRNSLRLANGKGLTSVAFPAISCGVFGYPLRAAAQVAVQTLKEEQEAAANDANASVEEVHFYLFGQPELDAWQAAAEELCPSAVEEGEGEEARSPGSEVEAALQGKNGRAVDEL